MTDSPLPFITAPVQVASMHRQIVGLLVVAVLLVLAMVAGIAIQHDLFSKRAQLHFVTENANGLAPGTSVRLSGYRVGAVSAMALQPDLKVRVTLSIAAEHFGSLRGDASALLVREQLRAPALELRPGKLAGALVGDDPVITYQHGGSLTEIADDLRDRLAPILDDVKQLTGTLRQQKGDIAALLGNAASASRDLAGTAQSMRALVGDAGTRVKLLGAQAHSALADVNPVLSRAGQAIGQAQTSLAAVNADLPVLLQRSGDLLEQLNAVARDVRTVSSSTASSVPGLLRSVSPVVDDTRDIVTGFKQSWPVKQMLPATPPTLLPIDSHDAASLRERAGVGPAPR